MISASQSLSPFVTAGALVVLASVIMMLSRRRKQGETIPTENATAKPSASASYPLATLSTKELPHHMQRLLAELSPGSVLLQSDHSAFQQAIENNYWAQQNREIIPACIVRPRDAQQLSKAVKILKQEYDDSRRTTGTGNSLEGGLFAIRSGGLNPGLGAATVTNGVVIDLGLICEVTPAADGSTVTIGAGAKWIDVYKTLEEKGLVVVGGRSTPAGVGGLALQGGISFYSGRYGFVCSNVERYEVVLANGDVVTASASASEHPDLWRVLKGGGNNFGIVTRITLRSFPLEPLWFGQVFAPAAFQQNKAMSIYHGYLQHAGSGDSSAFDENAAGPILTFVYLRGVPFHIMALQLVYTKTTPENKKQWPDHWKKSAFSSLWTIYRDCSVRSHRSAVEQNGKTAPPGTRHIQATTTIRNDLETMQTAYAIFSRTTERMRHVKGLLFPLTFQPILPGWMNKGHPNILGLRECTEPLIIIGCSVTWAEAKDDQFVRTTIHQLLDEIDAAAAERGTGHPYRFVNYCMDFQRPYDGCSEEVRQIMRDASHKYDPDGLFQKACVGGHKLPV